MDVHRRQTTIITNETVTQTINQTVSTVTVAPVPPGDSGSSGSSHTRSALQTRTSLLGLFVVLASSVLMS